MPNAEIFACLRPQAARSAHTGASGERQQSRLPLKIHQPLLVQRERTRIGMLGRVEIARTIDMLIVRENTEDLYVRRERLEDNGDTAIAERVITRSASRRIAQVAFEQARLRAAQPMAPSRCRHRAAHPRR